MGVPAGVGSGPQRGADQKALRLVDPAALAVLLHPEERLLDEVLGILWGAAAAHEQIAQATQELRQAIHAPTMT